MKNIKIILLVFFAFATFSCSSFLDEEPLSLLSENSIYNTIDDGKAGVVGIYEGMASDATWQVEYHVKGFGTMGGDLLCSTDVANQRLQMGFASYTLTSSHKSVKDNWAAIYKVINRANEAIIKLPKIADETGTITSLIAEAKFLRALHYFDLVRFYGAVPLKLKATTNTEELNCPKSDELTIYNQIVSDLLFAQENFNSSVSGSLSIFTIKTLLAQVYLTMAGFPLNLGNEYFLLARDKSKEVIDEKVLPGLNPVDVNSAFKTYSSFFTEEGEKTNEEDLFSVLFSEGDDLGGACGYRSINGGNRTESPYHYYYAGTQVNGDFALSFHDDDVRFKWSIGSYGLNPKNARVGKPINQWTPSKFRFNGRPGNPYRGGVNAPILRMAHAYLIFAEAENEINPASVDALAAINAVRNRAMVPEITQDYLLQVNQGDVDMAYGMSSVSFNNEATAYNKRHVYYDAVSVKERFREAIKMENAWEFCFERQRWFDLKRWDDLYERVKNTKQLKNVRLNNIADPIDKSDFKLRPNPALHYFSYSSIWPATDIQPYSNYLPIPETEIRLNDAIGFEDQNSGY